MDGERLPDQPRQEEAPKEPYRPRPLRQLILAWVLIAIVLFGFLGTCYWMIHYGV